MWWQIAAALIGAGLMAAPDLLRLPNPTANLVNILAPIAVAFAVIATSEVTRGLRYAASVTAAGLALGTVLLGAPLPVLAAVAGGGALMALVALGGGRTRGSYGGGWRVLLP